MNAGERGRFLFKKFMPVRPGGGTAGNILDSTMTRSVIASPQNVEVASLLSLAPRHNSHPSTGRRMHEEAFAKGRQAS
jgi:hypothetical protein